MHTEKYFHRKATKDVNHFVQRSMLGKISIEKDGVLHWADSADRLDISCWKNDIDNERLHLLNILCAH